MTLKPFNLEEAKAGKPIVCRDGTPAKFIAYLTEAKPGWRYLALVEGIPHAFNEDGSFAENGLRRHSVDLFMAPERKTVWVNIYAHDGSEGFLQYNRVPSYYKTKALADERASSDRIACVPVTYTEGEGL